MRKSTLYLLLPLFVTAPLHAQIAAPAPAGEDLLDRVVAVVADTVLLLSDVQSELMRLEAAGQLPSDPVQRDQVARSIIENNINDLLLVVAAREAGITITDEQIAGQVDARIRQIQQNFPSEAEFTRALAESGLSREQYRRTLLEQARNELLAQQYVQNRLRNRARPVINDSDVREFFETQRASLQQRPATVSLRQVLVAARPSEEARQAATERGQEVLRELRTGGDFAVLARRFSDDAGTKEHGGDLGWFRTGRMVPEFERAAFAMRAGQTSGLVETAFGFHIIRVDRTRGAERQARHILIRPEIVEADVERARVRADSVLQAARGGASMATLASRYNAPDEVGQATRVTFEGLPPEYTEAIGDAAPGTLVGPVRLEDPRGDRWAVIQITERQEAGDYTLEDARDEIRQRLEQDAILEQVLRELRQRYYVDVKV